MLAAGLLAAFPGAAPESEATGPAFAAAGPASPVTTPASAVTTPEAETDEAPLVVSIDTLSPAVVPDRGKVTITGSVTNVSEDSWEGINVYPLTSYAPLRTAAQVRRAEAQDPAEPVGDRVVTEGAFDTIDALAPGQSSQYLIRLPRSQVEVSGRPGVYWLGVQALGQSPEGRDLTADGRARTFWPLVPRGTGRRVRVAVVLPVRRGVKYLANGRVDHLDRWTRDLAPGGGLRDLVDLGAAAADRPLTWLVDPQVPATAARLAAGNPPRGPGLAEPDPDGGPGSPEEDPPTEPADGAAGADGADGSRQAAGGAVLPARQAALDGAAAAAEIWLDRYREAVRGSQVLRLPYGDMDAAAAAVHAPDLYVVARDDSRLPASARSRGRPALAPPSGYLDPAVLDVADPATIVLAADRAFTDRAPAVALVSGQRVVTTSAAVASGGPGPDDPFAPVAVRQRILAEAALRHLAGEETLVALAPRYWDPASAVGFWEAFDDLDWLRLTGLAAATPPGTPVEESRLVVPEELPEPPTEAATFAAAASLVRAADTARRVTETEAVAAEVTAEALTATSYELADRPVAARSRLTASQDWLERRFRRIQVEAPASLTLSAETGPFNVVVRNGLDQQVTVRVAAIPDERVRIESSRPIQLGPGQRATVQLTARSTILGVHNVTLVVTDTEGTRLGSVSVLPVRAARVSQVIWLILGTGVALLATAIGIRLVRRVRGGPGAGRGPDAEAGPHDLAATADGHPVGSQ